MYQLLLLVGGLTFPVTTRDLDSRDFKTREAASARLQSYGWWALPRILAGGDTDESQQRLELLGERLRLPSAASVLLRAPREPDGETLLMFREVLVREAEWRGGVWADGVRSPYDEERGPKWVAGENIRNYFTHRPWYSGSEEGEVLALYRGLRGNVK